MTILFAAYHDFNSNSSIQIFSLANRMVELGHCVHVCVPDGKETALLPGEPRFSCCTHAEALERTERFGNDPDGITVHAWTPRERVRKFVTRLRASLPCRTIVHLEDNEDFVAASLLGQTVGQLLSEPDEVLDTRIPDSLSHPHRYRRFLADADGATHLIDRLAEFIPAEKPRLMFWPAHNGEIFHAMPLLLDERHRLGIADHETILAYCGNVTAANRNEVASLYLAVIILRRMGHAVRLVRTGTDYTPLFKVCPAEMSEAVLALGHLERHDEIPRVLGMADFLVQPGCADDYNDYRFPSKLPEFFSIGRPVLLPHTNLGRFVCDGEDAIVLHEGHAMEIGDRIDELLRNADKREHLSRGALAFSREHFDWGKAAASLIEFYREVHARPVSGSTQV